MPAKAISLFDKTGIMLEPWRDAGYECHLYDIQHTGDGLRDDGMFLHYADLSELPNITGDVAFISCFPPCTHLAVSGARWFTGKGLRALQESIGYFATCIDVVKHWECPWLIENPMSTISTYWRAPDHKFHPAHYRAHEPGDNYTKETWIWCSQSFVMPPRAMGPDLFLEPDRDYIHKQPPGPERADIRSATPRGFAKAVFDANHWSRTATNGI